MPSCLLAANNLLSIYLGITADFFYVLRTELYLNNEGQSVKRSQMEIKLKTCDIRNWKRKLFIDISSTNIGTLVLSLYQCV
jgi:hypothetical protein